MKIKRTCHIYWDTKIDKYLDQIILLMEKYFENRSYSIEIETFAIAITCTLAYDIDSKPEFLRKEKLLILSSVIDYTTYMSLNDERKKELIALSIIRDIKLLSKFRIKDFQLEKMTEDFINFFTNIGWMK